MSSFDQPFNGAENNFIRHNAEMLTSIFGTTAVTPFWIADTDFDIPDPVKAELQRLANRGRFPYELDSERVFSAISRWHQTRNNLELDSQRFVKVPNVLTGIALLIRELTESGDSVVIQSPVYHQFPKVVSSAGRVVVNNPLRVVDGKYRMNLDDLDTKLADERTKVMILCNPHNPVGRVWVKDELENVLEIANKQGVTVVSDEIHSDIIYPGHRFTSLMALDPKNHVALIGSPAKTFGMHSISNGYIYTENSSLYKSVHHTEESMYLGHGNAFSTYATIAAYEHGGAWLDELLVYLGTSIDWINSFLRSELPTVAMLPVEGTYQIWLDFTATGLSQDEIQRCYTKAGAGFSPGTWFDQDATHFVRMNIAAPLNDIKEAFNNLKVALR